MNWWPFNSNQRNNFTEYHGTWSATTTTTSTTQTCRNTHEMMVSHSSSAIGVCYAVRARVSIARPYKYRTYNVEYVFNRHSVVVHRSVVSMHMNNINCTFWCQNKFDIFCQVVSCPFEHRDGKKEQKRKSSLKSRRRKQRRRNAKRDMNDQSENNDISNKPKWRLKWEKTREENAT